MSVTDHVQSSRAAVQLTGTTGPGPSSDHQPNPPDGPHGCRDHGLGLVPQPALHPSSLQLDPTWFSLGPPSSGQSALFLQPVDPFPLHQPSSFVDFALGIQSQAIGYDDQHVTPPNLPLSGPGPTSINFDFEFPLPQWESNFADVVPLAHATWPDTNHAADHSTFTQEASCLGDDEATSTASHRSSHGTTREAQAINKKQRKKKNRADSTASGSAHSASVASTQESFPFPDPVSNPSNPLNPSSTHPTDRRRSSRTKGRARSIATTTSASSSSTAPTPSSASGPLSGHRSRAPAAIINSQELPSNTANNSSRLRSASRASKNSVSRPSDTAEERRTRASHNLVEKQYRNRLNAQFESLLVVLPDPDAIKDEDVTSDTGFPPNKTSGAPTDPEQQPGDKKVSKAEVLERARAHIESLERQSEALARKREMLLETLGRAEKDMASSSSGNRRGLLGSLEAGDKSKERAGDDHEASQDMDVGGGKAA